MGADLNNIVKTQKLSDEHVQFLVYQILRGMKYVHSAGIIHRVSFHKKFVRTLYFLFNLANKMPNNYIIIYILGFKALQYSCE